MRTLATLLSIVALAAASMPALADDADSETIRHLMMTQFDRPDSRLTVEPITVSEHVAVAGWAQGDRGGRALLRRIDGGWVLTLCSGDALKEAKSLQQSGLSAKDADTMAKAVTDAEAKLDPALVAKFSTFDGMGHGGDVGRIWSATARH